MFCIFQKSTYRTQLRLSIFLTEILKESGELVAKIRSVERRRRRGGINKRETTSVDE